MRLKTESEAQGKEAAHSSSLYMDYLVLFYGFSFLQKQQTTHDEQHSL